jgi:hypothetical protein
MDCLALLTRELPLSAQLSAAFDYHRSSCRIPPFLQAGPHFLQDLPAQSYSGLATDVVPGADSTRRFERVAQEISHREDDDQEQKNVPRFRRKTFQPSHAKKAGGDQSDHKQGDSQS